MAKTIVHENESIDDALRRFKRSVSRSGTLQEYRNANSTKNQVFVEN